MWNDEMGKGRRESVKWTETKEESRSYFIQWWSTTALDKEYTCLVSIVT